MDSIDNVRGFDSMETFSVSTNERTFSGASSEIENVPDMETLGQSGQERKKDGSKGGAAFTKPASMADVMRYLVRLPVFSYGAILAIAARQLFQIGAARQIGHNISAVFKRFTSLKVRNKSIETQPEVSENEVQRKVNQPHARASEENEKKLEHHRDLISNGMKRLTDHKKPIS